MLLASARLGFLGRRASPTKTAAVTAPFAVARKTRAAAERGNAIMLRMLKCPVIALEEHYWDKELAALFAGAEGVRDPQTLKRLYDLGAWRAVGAEAFRCRRG